MKYKKIIITVVISVLVCALIGGGSFAYYKHLNNKGAAILAKEGKEYLLKGEYTDAEKYYEEAKELNDKNDEYSHMLMLIRDYSKIEDFYNSESFDEAMTMITSIKNNPYYSFIKSTVEKKENSILIMKEINVLDTVVNNYLTSNDFDSALNAVNEYVDKDIKDSYREKLTRLLDKITTAKQEYQDNLAESKQVEPPIVVTPTAPVVVLQPDNGSDNNTPVYDTVKSQYLNRLNELSQSSYAEYENNIKDCCDADLAMYAERLYIKWDAMLNEIWGVLTEQLPADQMEALTDNELAWIAEKEETGEQIKSNKDAAEMNFVMQTYYETFADMTRNRCYILVNMYMQ